MDSINVGDGLGRRRRKRSRRLGALPTLVGFGARKRGGKRKGRKVCVRTAAGKKVCGVRWRKRSKKR